MAHYQLIDNTGDNCFEFHIDGQTPRIDYARSGNAVALTHTEIPAGLRGQGVGTALVEAVLTRIDNRGEKVVPLCGFVAGYIRENPQWKRLVADGMDNLF